MTPEYVSRPGSRALFTARKVSGVFPFVCRLQTFVGGSALIQNRTGTLPVPGVSANHYHHEGVMRMRSNFALTEASRSNGFSYVRGIPTLDRWSLGI